MERPIKANLAKGFRYHRAAEELAADITERSLAFRDLFTVPTAISLSGLGLVIHGSRRIETLQGVNEIAAGRCFDLCDGFVARAFDQESDTGSLVDAGADKIAMGIITQAAWRKRVVPRHILCTLVASNAANASLTAIAAHRHPETPLRPSLAGKHAMALYNGSILSHAYASALERERPDLGLHEPLRQLGDLTFHAGTFHAVIAAGQYARRIR